MKKILIAALAAACVALSGCAAPGSTAPATTPAQLIAAVAKFCPLAKTELAQFQAMGVFTGGAATTYATQVVPAVNNLCTAASGTIPSTVDIDTIVDDVLPAIVDAITASNLSSTDKGIAIGGVGMLQGALIFVTSDAPVSTVPQTTPASAPLAA
jgi:hypothetical protein